MAINPLSWPVANVNSQIDFSPLSKLGDSINDQIYQSQAEKLIAQLLGQSQQQAQQQPLQQPTRTAALPPQAAPPDMPIAGSIPLPRQRPASADVPAAPGYWSPTQVGQAAWGQGQPTSAPPAGPNAQPVFGPRQAAPLFTLQQPQQPQQPENTVADAQASMPAPPVASAPPAAAAPAVEPSTFTQQQEPVAYTPAGIENVMRVIRQKESSGDYSNVTTSRARSGRSQSALGAYGVMDFNVGPWTREVLGREMSPQEFLNDRNAQDAVAKAKLSQYAQKYGTTGAAKAWFAGEGGMKNPNARDALGTSVSAYAADFERKLGRDGDLPPEITGGQSRPTSEQPSQAMSFDQVRSNVAENLISPQPARNAGITSEQISALYRNPHTRQLALGFLQKQLDPGSYEFMAAGDGIVRYNKKDGSYTMISTPQKPIVVPKDSALVSSEGKSLYGGGPTDEDKYGKLPSDFRWKDPLHKELGVEAIPDSPGSKVGEEVSARLGLGRSFAGQLPEIRDRLDKGEVGIDNPANHFQAMTNVGAPGELKRKMDAGADALLRMLTGAGMGIQEAKESADQYRLTARDTSAAMKSKIDQLERHMLFIADTHGKGRGGSLIPPPDYAVPGREKGQAPGGFDAYYSSLKPGTPYTGPDGVPRIKR